MPNRALLAAIAAALLSACASQVPAPAERAASDASVAGVQSEAQRLDMLEAKVDRWIAAQQGG